MSELGQSRLKWSMRQVSHVRKTLRADMASDACARTRVRPPVRNRTGAGVFLLLSGAMFKPLIPVPC